MSSDQDTTSTDAMHSLHQAKLSVFQRDQQRCTNCGRHLETAQDGDLDHNVPRGDGGANGYRNLTTLCRICHEAKHQPDQLAPTAEFVSTGQMNEREFAYHKHFFKQMLPALTRQVLQPEPSVVFDIDDRGVWHIPTGDLQRLDEELMTADELYRSLKASQYM